MDSGGSSDAAREGWTAAARAMRKARRSPRRLPCRGFGISADSSDPALALARKVSWKPEEGSISHRVQRLPKYRFLKKQSDLLLNADDLDAMWACLRENCVIDDTTGAEKINYEDFCPIASACTEQIGQKYQRFFSPSNFMKF